MSPHEAFVAQLPKAELHLHIEGTLEPDLLFTLAQRNDVELPFSDVAAVRDAYEFADLQSFLDIYYQGAAVLLKTQDFHDLMARYLSRAHADGVRRAEIFFDPQVHTARGIGFDVFMPGFVSAIEEARAEYGISVGLIMCFLRHLPVDAASATFDEATDYMEHIIGVGLDSGEVGNPPEAFAPVFDRAATAGLHRVAHAGEEGPAGYIWGALDVLGAERIDHGVRCDDDPALVARLVDDQTPLTMCPLSNLRLRVVDELSGHNLARLLEQGVRVTINSDDPAYFGGYVVDNYIAAASALSLDRSQLVQLARNSFSSSFTSTEDKRRWLEEIDTFLV
jgi:adenosine deaminase